MGEVMRTIVEPALLIRALPRTNARSPAESMNVTSEASTITSCELAVSYFVEGPVKSRCGGEIEFARQPQHRSLSVSLCINYRYLWLSGLAHCGPPC